MKFFSHSEFESSPTAAKKKIDNKMNERQRKAVELLVENVLDPLRDAVGKPVRITSGFRSFALNSAVNGSAHSQHTKGEAADIKVEGMTALELFEIFVREDILFDQIVCYAPERGGHLHVSFTYHRLREEVLFAPRGKGYKKMDYESLIIYLKNV